MKLWLVFLLMGDINGVVGPLPYDMVECLNSKQHFQAEVDSAFLTGRANEAPSYKGKKLTREDIVIKCVESDDRPEIDGESVPWP